VAVNFYAFFAGIAPVGAEHAESHLVNIFIPRAQPTIDDAITLGASQRFRPGKTIGQAPYAAGSTDSDNRQGAFAEGCRQRGDGIIL
jgi:hypothetical protein